MFWYNKLIEKNYQKLKKQYILIFPFRTATSWINRYYYKNKYALNKKINKNSLNTLLQLIYSRSTTTVEARSSFVYKLT